MGTGGLIFVAILALWGLYLVPVLVKERAARLDHRADEAGSAAVRVLQRPAADRPSRRVVLTVDRPVVSDDLPARPTPDLAQTLRRDARRSRVGVRVRAAAAVLGVGALVVAVVASVAGALPVWSVAAAGAWLAGVVLSGAVVAASRRRAVAAPVRVKALPPRAHRVATEVFDDRASRPSVPGAAPARASATATVGTTSAADERVDDTWTPVEVPGPVYASKPASHRPPALPWSMPGVLVSGAPGAEPAPSVLGTAEEAAAAEPTAGSGEAAPAPAARGSEDGAASAQIDLRAADEPAEARRSATG